MADKNINFNIKVNNKELDLTKTSFKDFDNIIKQAKKDLQALPISDPRYKVLQTDIKNADAAWKEMNKTISQSGDEMDNAGGKVETYKKQIKEATDELFRLEQQFGKNSKEYTDQQQKIAGLRDAQEELVRTTQDLDDTLAAIPGPIGQIGSAMQQVEGITQNVGSAMNKLGVSFTTFDGILKASGIGALVLLVATLVAAIMKAAKSFEPLQVAFAKIQDAVGALFNALKPVTDFLLNVFTTVITVVADALSSVAGFFGGTNNHLAETTRAMDKNIAAQERMIKGYTDALSEYAKSYSEVLLQFKKDSNEADKAAKEGTMNMKDYYDTIFFLATQRNNKMADLTADWARKRAIQLNEVEKLQADTEDEMIKSSVQRQKEQLKSDETFNSNILRLEKLAAKTKKEQLEQNLYALNQSDVQNKQEAIFALEQSIRDQESLMAYYDDKLIFNKKHLNNQLSLIDKEKARNDIALINERSLQIQELSTQLLKDEEARNLQQATLAINRLKEQHRLELEEATLAGQSLEKLKEKQTAEMAVAFETERKATIQYDAWTIQQEIDKQNRLLVEVGIGTQQYFDTRKEIAHKELEQELLLADGNEVKIEAARSKHWKAMLDIDKEGIQSQIDILNIEYNTLYEGTVAFYEKQRELENKNYEAAQLEAQGNYDKLEALRKQHERNMKMIDLSELQSTVDILQRQADTKQKLFQGYYKAQLEAEEADYALRLKAAGDNYALIETLEMEHRQRKRMMREQELSDYIQMYSQISGVVSGFLAEQDKVNQLENQLATQRLEQKYQAQNEYDKKTITDATQLKNKLLKNEKDKAKEEDDIKKKYFYINKNSQIAQATIATLQAAVQAYSALAGIPVVGPALGAAAAAVALGFGYTQVKLIKQQEYVSTLDTSGGEAKPTMANYGRNYEQGGLIGGARHAQGGTLIEAEKGEAIMTRGAVTMFGPMLSMMNQAGGGTSFNTNLMTTSYDKPNVSKPSEEQNPIIVKSYVVSSELTSEQNKQARLKDLSTL